MSTVDVNSLRYLKDSVKRVEDGEFGIVLDDFRLRKGDYLEFFNVEMLHQTFDDLVTIARI